MIHTGPSKKKKDIKDAKASTKKPKSRIMEIFKGMK